MNFLLGQNFRMGAPFHGGVQYFSRAEEATARLLAAQRQDRPSIVDTQPRPGDTESLELLRRLQEEVTAWKNLTAVRLIHDHLNNRLTAFYSRHLIF